MSGRARQQYDQCDATCTVDCGHCKGQGPPWLSAPVGSLLRNWGTTVSTVTVEYGLKYTEADGRVSHGVFLNRDGAERTAAAITGRGWSTVRVEVEERDVSPWRPAKPVEEVPPKPLDVSDTTG